MHKYIHEKVPESFTDTIMIDELQSRHNDYIYVNEPAIKRNLKEDYLSQYSLETDCSIL